MEPEEHTGSPYSSSHRIFAAVALSVIWVAVVYTLVGQLESTLGNTYLVLLLIHLLLLTICILIWNPVLMKRRMMSPIGKTWDLAITVIMMFLLIGLILIAVQDLNARGHVPGILGTEWTVGLCLFVGGWLVLTWSMTANPFFEKNVRIQTNHGHHVIDGGPYAYIRHPGYIGFSALLIATPLMIASNWTAVPALLIVVMLVVRTVFEDRMLQADLPGYREYADRVRYRLIPGVW